MLVALALLPRDALEILTLLPEGEDIVVGVSGLLLEDVLVDLAQDRPLGGVVVDRCRIFRMRLWSTGGEFVGLGIA